jgi:hypothetical protein
MTGAWVYCELPTMIASAPKLDRIESALKSLTDTRSLKELFYDRLHYDRVSEPISTRRFSPSVQATLKDSESLLLANGGVGGQFKVIYTRLSSQQIYKQEQRGIIEALLGIHPHSLFVFSNQTQDDWHFINAKHDEQNTQRRLLRRIVVNQREQLRTAIEQIGELDLQAIGQECGKKAIELAPLEIQIQHDEAFDVEKVTDRFFKQYKEIFESVEGSIEGIPNEEQKHLFTQKLFNRLMFIAFVQKKDWLEFNGSQDYFKALWQDYKKAKSQPLGNFYRDRLSHLFFEGLNDPDKQGDKKLIKLIGNVPYLNGGLFEKDVSEAVPGIVVPDNAIEDILTKLFDRFNFTVSESTPLDVDVAVDPEMLGKVFEELCNNRHGSGSYYTPKPIVAFMCRETLKGYLKSKCAEDVEKIDRFVDDHESGDLADPEAILTALKAVTVCDPACGSGAYLLGMMHELLELRACLFASDKLGAESVYARKLEIIEHNLYGVDKNVFAVNIARLRLWLSLSVDGDKPKPLPNLKYKLEVGDSLLAPMPTTQQSSRDVLVPRYRELKAKYVTAHVSSEKKNLEKEITALKVNIAGLIYGGINPNHGFDWVVEFAEVIGDGGFDIQIANPPYIEMGSFKDDKPVLAINFKEIYTGRADLCCYFYGRSLQLLKTNGILAFISSNKWLKAGYGEKLRQHIAKNYHVHSITDFGDLPVFKKVAAYPMILICSNKSTNYLKSISTQVKSLDHPFPNVKEVIEQSGIILPENAICNGNWLLSDNITAKNIKQMEQRGVTLSDYVKDKICYGVKSGLTKAFVIDGETRNKLIFENPASEKIIKPLVTGKDISKWHVKDKDKYLLYMYHGIDIEEIGAVINYLKPYRQRLENRATKQKWYELQQPQLNYSTAFDKPKIIYQTFQVKPCFTYSTQNYYPNNSVWAITIDDLYLLGVLNSKPFWSEVSRHCTEIQNGYQLIWKYLEKAIIPNASEIERKVISKLVQKCLDAKGVGCEAWEKEIDIRVAKLYGFEDNYDLN